MLTSFYGGQGARVIGWQGTQRAWATTVGQRKVFICPPTPSLSLSHCPHLAFLGCSPCQDLPSTLPLVEVGQ